MSRRLPSVVAATLAAAVLASSFAPPMAEAKDDPAKIKAAREAVRKDYKEKKYFLFHDLSYYVDAPALKESRWAWKDPPFAEASDEGGPQFYATWSPMPGGDVGIEIQAIKMPHFKEGTVKTIYNHAFKSWGK